jgi:hypothetical protein
MSDKERDAEKTDSRLPRSFQLLLDFARSRGIVLSKPEVNEETKNHGDNQG